jgi:membrane-bound lytic murein transglycosylase B
MKSKNSKVQSLRLIGAIKYISMVWFIGLNSVGLAQAEYLERVEVQAFVRDLVATEGFSAAQIVPIIAAANYKQTIIDAISRPAEKVLTWKEYQDIFLTARRVKEGRQFMVQQHQALTRAHQQYGVPPEIIAAIIGVETMYGSNKGSYRVIDALATLAFDYPPRSQFFLSELKQFLLLTREEQLDPLLPMGSYAGAMGYGQFISSSYRHYAVDFDADGKRDIWDNPVDAVGSVANYLAMHGWQAGGLVTVRSKMVDDALTTAPAALAEVYNVDLKPTLSLSALSKLGLSLAGTSSELNTLVSPMQLNGKQGAEVWLGFQNFYAITRYNHSKLYAMAVFQLSEQLKALDLAN